MTNLMGMMVKRFVDNNLIGNSKSVQSPSNEFKVTYIEFRNQLIITTSKFTEDYINDQNSFRLELIYKLYERGLSNREITDYLILLGIKKRNTKNTNIKDCINVCN